MFGKLQTAQMASGLIPSLVKPVTAMLVFTASLVDAQHASLVDAQCGEQAGKLTCYATGKGVKF